MCAETPDYKSTLFLPKTDFPMRAGLPKREPEWLSRWEGLKVYDRLRETTKGREPFILHDGPPYANGHLHIGHALNKVLKDFIVRSQQMMGRDARYVPGWDCHGLPIEWKIEEKYRSKGKNKDDVPINELRAECRRFAGDWIDIQRAEFKRLGVTGKWDDPYLTMDFHAEAVIADEFMKFVMNDSLYLGSKPVMWSPVEKTALAEAEVEYAEHQSHTIWVKFPVVGCLYDNVPGVNPPNVLDDASVVIWTTTPWTIPSNRGVAYSGKTSYGVYRVTDAADDNWVKVGEKLVIADSLVSDVMKSSRVDAYERVGDAPDFRGATLQHPLAKMDPFWSYEVPMLEGDFVTEDAGTGFVHTAPSHGADDYELFVKNGLTDRMTHNVLEDSSFAEHVPFFAGLQIFDRKGKEGKANTAVIAKLAEAGTIAARGRVKHSYPHSWRSKAPVIYRNTPQWFVAIDRPLDDGMGQLGDTIRQRALTAIDTKVKWTPQTGRNRLHSMMEARPDWVLSRQRAWGVPLTCFIKRIGEGQVEILQDATVNARIKAEFEANGADAWFEDDAKAKFLGSDHPHDEWEKVTDILDVWFDSGSTHAFVLRDREDGQRPADLYLEGTDQHRGWFHSSLLQACGTTGEAPYKGVLTHGFTLDEKGMKMSKSLGNTVSPDDVVKQYGADILRLWVAQSDYTADQRIGQEILKGTADSYRRLRNTLRFILGALDDFSEEERVAPEDMPELERYMLHRLAELDVTVREGYAGYDFQHLFQSLFQFCTIDCSSVYFDIRKDALYCDAADSLRRRSARTVLDLIFHRLTTWFAPILCFTMEEVWLQRFPGDDSSVHLVDFPETPSAWRNDALSEKWSTIRRVRRVVTGALEVERQEKRIGASLEAAPVVYLTDQPLLDILTSVPFEDVCITSSVELSLSDAPETSFRLDGIEGIAVVPGLAEGQKCARCWKILPDVGSHSHTDVCERCDDALS